MVRRLFALEPSQLGKGPVEFAWRDDGNLLAVAGSNKRVLVVDRRGNVISQFGLSGNSTGTVLSVQWDSTGQTLAVMQANSESVTLWDCTTEKAEQLDTKMKDVCFMTWNRKSPSILAIGTAKGNLLLYYVAEHKRVPIVGKHSKKITCGAWNSSNQLALGSEDRDLSLSDEGGDTNDQAHMKADPIEIQFSDTAEERKKAKERTVSVNLAGKTLLLYNTADTENPIELAFQARYGNITSYRWFGDGYILIGFSTGFVVIISTHTREIGQEVNSVRFHRDNLSDVTYSAALQKGASIGDNVVKIFEMSELGKMSEQRSEKIDLDSEYGALQKVRWTEDGQILTVSSKTGYIYTYLTKLSVLNGVHGSRILSLTSLRELSVKDMVADDRVVSIPIEVEPTFVSLGPEVAAVGMNDTVWYYRWGDLSSSLIRKESYLSTIQSVALCRTHTAVLLDKKVQLQPLENLEEEEARGRGHKTFPETEDGTEIVAHALTDTFLIYGTSKGSIHYFSLEAWVPINDSRYGNGIRAIYPNPAGTRVVLLDNQNAAYLYSPVNDSQLLIEDFSPTTEHIMWDTEEWGVFVGCDATQFTTYIHSPYSRRGGMCKATRQRTSVAEDMPPVCKTERPYGFTPVMCFGGNVVCQMPNGSMVNVQLDSHQHTQISQQVVRLNGDQMYQAFYNNLELNRLESAWRVATQLSMSECWSYLAERALHLLDIQMAMRAYRQLQQPGLVLALQKLVDVKEKSLLLGHTAVVLKDFQDAHNNFQRSSNPMCALDMRRDLMHWDEALKLAEGSAPELVPIISREYAQQLEFNGEYQSALNYYKQGRVPVPDPDSIELDNTHMDYAKIIESNRLCTVGIARTSIRLGHIRESVQLALDSEDNALCVECAQILEERKPQWNDAAQLYERAGVYDRAIDIYIEQKSTKNATRLLEHVTKPRVLKRYADLMKAEGKYKEAEAAYERAGEWDAVVVMNANYLDNLSKAYEVVRKTKSAEAANDVAAHCKKRGDISTAIEFLLLAKRQQEAFDLAKSGVDPMKTYARVLGDKGKVDDYVSIAAFYEKKAAHDLAGDFYAKGGKYDRALDEYLLCGEEKIEEAIQVVGKAKVDTMTGKLIDFLTGAGEDNTPKDRSNLLKMYTALGNYERAARTAVSVAKTEQDSGQYREAHRVLFQMHQDMVKHNHKVSADLKRALMLVHSYLIVRSLAKVAMDHEASARMLVRVSKNINKFPQHVVPILTSAFVECKRVNFEASAMEFAGILVQPENRGNIQEKFKSKIETAIRKRGRTKVSDPDEPTSPCPFCSHPVADTTLQCPSCQDTIPYCIFSGKHMVKEDWSRCPNCTFPALYSQITKIVPKDPVCPMCEEPIEVGEIKTILPPSKEETEAV